MNSTLPRSNGQAVTAAYPARQPYFAHKFARLLVKTCAAQEIGTGGCWLLTTIVHTEDAARYRRAVTWRNEQLAPVLGMSPATLVRVRQQCIDEGWLHYEPGVKRKPGKYWVTIPPDAIGIDDNPTDEGADTYTSSNLNGIRTECESESERYPDGIRTEFEYPSTLTLPSDPAPETSPDREARAPADGMDEEIQDVVNLWNAVPGITTCRKLTERRRAALRKRLADPDWHSNWRNGIERIGKSSFCMGAGQRGWRARFDWFVEPDTLNKILEGQYDDGQQQRNGTARSGGSPTRTRSPETAADIANLQTVRAAGH
jgi:hypothetical protein